MLTSTSAEAFVVDPWLRESIGRPRQTFATDSASECAVGFFGVLTRHPFSPSPSGIALQKEDVGQRAVDHHALVEDEPGLLAPAARFAAACIDCHRSKKSWMLRLVLGFANEETEMVTSRCSEELSLDSPFMDQEHHTFLQHLSAVDTAGNAGLSPACSALVTCTVEHFHRENLWMHATSYAAFKGHAIQHRVVLEVMREGSLQADDGRYLQVREMAHQLRGWYTKHVQTMDAALAMHLRSMRFEPANDGAERRSAVSVSEPVA